MKDLCFESLKDVISGSRGKDILNRSRVWKIISSEIEKDKQRDIAKFFLFFLSTDLH